jgi:hypothetical protein
VPRIGITGHRGLPPRTQALITAALRKELEPDAGVELVGVSSLAGGPDQLFARTVLDLGGTLEVVVPAEQYRDGLDPDERKGYDDLVAEAKHVERLPFVESTEQAHLAAGQRWSIAVSAWWRCGTAARPWRRRDRRRRQLRSPEGRARRRAVARPRCTGVEPGWRRRGQTTTDPRHPSHPSARLASCGSGTGHSPPDQTHLPRLLWSLAIEPVGHGGWAHPPIASLAPSSRRSCPHPAGAARSAPRRVSFCRLIDGASIASPLGQFCIQY